MIGDRWGVSEADVARRYPCDDVVASPALEAWRGVTAQAAREQVWSRVVQVRLAPYSYDWVDNLGRRSPAALQGLADPVPGDPFTASAGRPLGTVLAVEPGIALTARVVGAVMSYVLVGEEPTRLLLKLVVPRSPLARVVAPAVCLGDLVMARRQLLNLARLAESDRR
ncbi:polyketide cyclase [Nocardioides mangrovicus]|uniref:Polyketide cyclase n=1 Tax=Nocardioides mangrovicus TaxID=2478913 RepID=A0A3L8P1Q4_9ACTN|nr:polyketide cyclase [Nocardioides mangrovicus]RLV49360.1 polyketide cyclase [Nocardioides mangrovicus]